MSDEEAGRTSAAHSDMATAKPVGNVAADLVQLGRDVVQLRRERPDLRVPGLEVD